MMPVCAMSVMGTIDDTPALCVELLSRCNKQPVESEEVYDDVPRHYSILPALGKCCGQRVLPLDARADVCLARVTLLLSANAFSYRYPSVVVLAGRDVLKLPLFAHARDCFMDTLQESFERIVREIKGGWGSTILERRMFLPITIAASPDQWYCFYHRKTGCPGRTGYLRCLDRLICSVADFYGLSSDIYFCSESWHASYEYLPTSPCASPITTDDGQCYLCVRKDALEEFERVFGFNLTALARRA